VEEIEQAAAAADQITRRLAAFSTPEASQPEVISVNGLVRRMARLIESVAGPRVDLSIRTAPDAGKVKAGAPRIEQAVMNLVLHASAVLNRGGTPGELVIETANTEVPLAGRMSNYVLVAVTHSGQEADFDRLFEPSSTGDDGLALSIVQSIAAEYGGYVSAQPAGSGCRFEMLLPRWSQPALLPRPGALPLCCSSTTARASARGCTISSRPKAITCSKRRTPARRCRWDRFTRALSTC
jgi:signal transduction histidine kinase